MFATSEIIDSVFCILRLFPNSLHSAPGSFILWKEWLSSCSTYMQCSLTGTKCKNQDRWVSVCWKSRRAFLGLRYLAASKYLKINLDVAANMTSGNRFCLLSLFLGIVLTRFSHCNQGEFNDPSPRRLNFRRYADSIHFKAFPVITSFLHRLLLTAVTVRTVEPRKCVQQFQENKRKSCRHAGNDYWERLLHCTEIIAWN